MWKVEDIDALVKLVLWTIGGTVIMFQTMEYCWFGVNCFSKGADDPFPFVTWVLTSANGGIIFLWFVISAYSLRNIFITYVEKRNENS